MPDPTDAGALRNDQTTVELSAESDISRNVDTAKDVPSWRIRRSRSFAYKFTELVISQRMYHANLWFGSHEGRHFCESPRYEGAAINRPTKYNPGKHSKQGGAIFRNPTLPEITDGYEIRLCCCRVYDRLHALAIPHQAVTLRQAWSRWRPKKFDVAVPFCGP